MDSRRALKRWDIFLDLSSCRACGGTRVRTEPTKITTSVRRPICQYFGITESMAMKGILVFVCCSVFLVLRGKPIDAAGECQRQGKVYNKGDWFILDHPSCLSCRCNGPDSVGCVPLCALEQYRCPAGKTPVLEDALIPGTECSCRKFVKCA